MVVLARVFETLGMVEKTAKSQATRVINKSGFTVTETGFISVADAITVLSTYEAEDNMSKYKAKALEVLADLKAGKLQDSWKNEVVKTEKSNAFDDVKVLKALLTKFPKLVAEADAIRAEIVANKK
jgi:hypothetical protein